MIMSDDILCMIPMVEGFPIISSNKKCEGMMRKVML
jgi:hypothetical protein